MEINRRTFALGLSATAFSVFSGSSVAMTRTTFVTSARNKLDGQFYAVGLDLGFNITWEESLPSRAHAPVPHPETNVVAFTARRPDRYVEIRSSIDGQKIHHITAARGRHFYGHGIFGPTGRYLFLTENAYDQGRGVVGVYDAHDAFKHIDEIPSGGIGPHEILLMPDGRSLVVANGGIRTHPDHGRVKLNLDSMIPSLQLIDAGSGALRQSFHFKDEAFHSLSIRHMVMMPDGRIIIGCQDQDVSDAIRPLVYITDRRTGTLNALKTPSAIMRKMARYVGSVAISAGKQLIAASCPRGNMVVLWDAKSLTYMGMIASNDVCGLTIDSQSGIIISTSGDGKLGRLDSTLQERDPNRHPFLQWDNHIALI